MVEFILQTSLFTCDCFRKRVHSGVTFMGEYGAYVQIAANKDRPSTSQVITGVSSGAITTGSSESDHSDR